MSAGRNIICERTLTSLLVIINYFWPFVSSSIFWWWFIIVFNSLNYFNFSVFDVVFVFIKNVLLIMTVRTASVFDRNYLYFSNRFPTFICSLQLLTQNTKGQEDEVPPLDSFLVCKETVYWKKVSSPWHRKKKMAIIAVSTTKWDCFEIRSFVKWSKMNSRNCQFWQWSDPRNQLLKNYWAQRYWGP